MKKIFVICFLFLVFLSMGKVSYAVDKNLNINATGGLMNINGEFYLPSGDHWSYDNSFIPQFGVEFVLSNRYTLKLNVIKSTFSAEGKYYLAQTEEHPDMKLDIIGGELKWLQITSEIKTKLTDNTYLLGGIGAYRWECDVQAEGGIDGREKEIDNEISLGTDPGVSIGGGLELKISEKISLRSECKYNLIISDYFDGGTYTIVGGISYDL